MEITVLPFTEERTWDVVAFELALRKEEDVWGWEIDDAYVKQVTDSFADPMFGDAVSLLAYADGNVVGRIDAAMIHSRFDGAARAYLDWICVLKSCRHQGVAQKLLTELQRTLQKRGVDTLVAITAANDEAQRFYRSIPNSEMHDTAIWIDL